MYGFSQKSVNFVNKITDETNKGFFILEPICKMCIMIIRSRFELKHTEWKYDKKT